MRYEFHKKHKSIAVILVAIIIVLSSGCSSGIEIVGIEKPKMTEIQQNQAADKLSKNTDLTELKFAYPEEEKAFFFALQLYFAQEYYRAITEFMRFMSYHEDSDHVQLAYFLVGESYRASGKFSDAVFFYEKSKSTKKADISWLADYNIAVCYILAEEYEKTQSEIAKLLEKTDSQAERKFFVNFLNMILQVADKKYAEAAKTLQTLDKKQLQELTGVEIDENDIQKFKDLSTRNVGLAVMMSALVPGLGQLYADRPLEALTSFLLTGLFTFIAYEAFSENHEVLGAVSSFLAASFYFANIFNSANAAVSYNENRRIEFYNRLLNKLDSDVLHFFLMPEETESGIALKLKVLR